MKKIFSVILLVAVSLTTLAQEQINFTSPNGIYPEGVVYYPQKDAFLVSSITKGQIGMVDKQGNYSVFLDNKNIISSVGLKIKENKLFVVVGDLGLADRSTKKSPKAIARLLVFDLNSKKLLQKTDLHKLYKGAHFANDITFDDNGDVYITDSFSPVIYKVNVKGKASVFVENELFKGDGINLNGIAFHPNGFLLVSKYATGELFKVDIKTNTVRPVKLSTPLAGLDGISLLNNNSLIAVQNAGNKAVHKLKSNDNWQTAYIIASDTKELNFPTTATVTNGEAYFLNAYLGDLFNNKNDRTQYFIRKFDAVYADERLIQQVNFKDIQSEFFNDKISRKVIPSNKGTFTIFTLKKGAHIPKHKHPQQQTTYIRSGSVKIIINDSKEHILTAGDVIVIPGNTYHEFFVLEDTENIDIFSPKREKDWILGKSKFLNTKK